MSAIYSNSITDRLLACLVQNPTLCLDEKYKLDKSEFAVNKFHQILYVSIYNLACNGYKTISIMDLNEFLKPYEAQYNYLHYYQDRHYIVRYMPLEIH